MPGSLSHTPPSHPPKPKDAGYLALGCLATSMPGRGVGVWPEAALIGEWRDGGRRFQGDVGFGEGWPRWARFLRQREARALGGRAATVRAEERVSRSQIVLSSEICPRTGHCTPPCPGRAPTSLVQPSAWPICRPHGVPPAHPCIQLPSIPKLPHTARPTRTSPFCIFASSVSLGCTPLGLTLSRCTVVPLSSTLSSTGVPESEPCDSLLSYN